MLLYLMFFFVLTLVIIGLVFVEDRDYRLVLALSGTIFLGFAAIYIFG